MTERRVIDCFMFFNEFDLLTYRLNTLNDVVDYFVIVEATHTYAGKEKPLFYYDIRDSPELAKFKNKIKHIIVNDFPYKYPNINIDRRDQWANEYHQRNCISRGIERIGVNDNDIIGISDLDEIPDRDVLRKLKNGEIQVDIASLELDLYYYNLNTSYGKWKLSKVINGKTYKALNTTCSNLRDYHSASVIPRAGWHLTYFGDSSFIKTKIESFSHQEYNKNQFTDLESINNRLKNFSDPFDRSEEKIEVVPVSNNNYLPHEYQTYLSKYVVL